MNIVKNLGKRTYLPSLILVLISAVCVFILNPNYFNMSFFSGFLTTYTPSILLAVAQAIVLFGGGFDISLGSMISLINVVIIVMLQKTWGLPVAIVVGILAGLCIGAINAFVISKLKVSALLTTLATSSIAQGLALTILPFPKGDVPMNFILWYQKVPSTIFLICLGLVIWGVWKFTPLHVQLFSLGNNYEKAYISGVPVRRIRFLSYLSTALVTGIAAVALTANVGGGNPTVGATYTLNSVAACVIGGISLSGGLGSIIGAVLGAVFLGLVFTIVLAAPLPTYVQQLVSGIIVLIGILLAAYIKKKTSKFA